MTVATYPRNGCTVVVKLNEDRYGFEAYMGIPAVLFDTDSGFTTVSEALEAGFVSADAVAEFDLTAPAPGATIAPVQAALVGI